MKELNRFLDQWDEEDEAKKQQGEAKLAPESYSNPVSCHVGGSMNSSEPIHPTILPEREYDLLTRMIEIPLLVSDHVTDGVVCEKATEEEDPIIPLENLFGEKQSDEGKGDMKKKKKRWKLSLETQGSLEKNLSSEELYGFVNAERSYALGQEFENQIEAKKDKCADQMLNKMLPKRKEKVMKKRVFTKSKGWKYKAKEVYSEMFGIHKDKNQKIKGVGWQMLYNHPLLNKMWLMWFRKKKGKTKMGYELKRIKQELMVAELLWGRKTPVKKPARWQKHKFKQKFNKKRERIKLRGFIMLTRKKLAAKENRCTYSESLEKLLRCQRDRRKRRFTYGQFRRYKFEPGERDHLNSLLQMGKNFKSESMRRMKRCNTVKCYCIWLKELLLWEIRVKKKKSQSGHNLYCCLTLDDMRLRRIKTAATQKSFSGKWRKGKTFRDKFENKQLEDKVLLSLHLRDIRDQSLRRKLLGETKYGGKNTKEEKNNKCNCFYMMLLFKRLMLEAEEQFVVRKSSDGSHVDSSGISPLVSYALPLSALEGKNNCLDWNDFDREREAGKRLITLCLLGSVFSLAEKNKEEQTKALWDFRTTTGQARETHPQNNDNSKRMKIFKKLSSLTMRMFEIQSGEHAWRLRFSEHSDFWVGTNSETIVRQADCIDEWSDLKSWNGAFLKTLPQQQLFSTDVLKEKAPPWVYGTFEGNAKFGEVAYGFRLTTGSKLVEVGLLTDKPEAMFYEQEQEEIKENGSQFLLSNLEDKVKFE